MCFAILVVKYRNDKNPPDNHQCADEEELMKKLKEVQSRPEATQIDVFIHNPHQSVQLVQEWRTRSIKDKS